MKLKFPMDLLCSDLAPHVDLPCEINLSGEVKLLAESEEDSQTKERRFLLIANTGKPMFLRGFFDPVIIDMKGAKFDQRKTPVIADHDTARRIGYTTSQKVIPAGKSAEIDGRTYNGPLIIALGKVASNSEDAKSFVEDSDQGFPFQVSVGAAMLQGAYIEAESEIEINGATVQGPIIHSKKSLIRELTITVLGADKDTSAKLVAKQKKVFFPSSTRKKGFSMEFKAYVASLGYDAENLSQDEERILQASYEKYKKDLEAKNKPSQNPPQNPSTPSKKELEKRNEIEAANTLRIDSIKASAETFSHLKEVDVDGVKMTLTELKAHCIKKNLEAKDFELYCLRSDRPTTKTKVPAIHDAVKDFDSKALECAILRRCGTPSNGFNEKTKQKYGLEAMYKEDVLEASHNKRYQVSTLGDLGLLQLQAAGKYYSGFKREFRDNDFRASVYHAWNDINAAPSAFSTLNITNVLENVLHKSSLAAFMSVEMVWSFICRKRSLNDFRPHNRYRINFEGSYQQVSPTGELKHVSMGDDKKTISADTFGAMITIDRKTQINDDLNVIVEQAQALGLLGGQRIEESVFVTLLANAGSHFSVGNGNLLSGASSVLGIDSLTNAKNLFRLQVLNGKPIAVSPQILLVPTTLEETANRLYKQGRLEATGSTDDLVFADNPHVGLYKPYITPYINNTGILDQDGGAISGQSDTQWYLMADPNAPQGPAIEIGFLDGREVPYFDSADTEFSIPGGLSFRSYLDWGVALQWPEMAVKSAGA